MRWGYLIPRLIMIGLIWGFFAFAFDPLLRRSAVSSLQGVTGAKVDIDHIATGFFPPRLDISEVALASASRPGSNLVEFDSATFHLAGQPLMRRNYVVEEATITGIRFETSREDNGQLDIVEDSAESGPLVPEWLQDKLKQKSDEWLDNLTRQTKAQLDPNRLETYQVGNELYVKWNQRFDQVNSTIQQTRQQADSIQSRIKLAKDAETIQQIELYLQIAADTERVLRDSQQFVTTLKAKVPVEARQDFQRLDQAQQNDRRRVAETIQSLKPDAGKITESMIGETLYLQLQQMLTWVQTLKDYQDQIKAPEEPVRSRGRDFPFPILNPTPKLLCRKALLSGELMLGDLPTPFRAVVTDITSDPALLGRPAVLQVQTDGDTPLRFAVRHDATSDIAVTDLSADFLDTSNQILSAGKPDSEQLLARLDNMHWTAQLRLQQKQISGTVNLQSRFADSEVRTARPYAQSLAAVAQQTLSSIDTINAQIQISGLITRPDVKVQSDLGTQVASGFQTAFQAELPKMKQEAMAFVTSYAAERKAELAGKLQGRYASLLQDHEKLVQTLNSAKTLVAGLRKGQVDPNAVYRTVSDSGLLKDKDQQKADRYFQDASKVLDGFRNPNQAIQNALPDFRKRLLDKL